MYIPDGEKEGWSVNMKPKESHETWAQTNSLLLLGIVDLRRERVAGQSTFQVRGRGPDALRGQQLRRGMG